jgi:MFS family permease
MLFIGVGITVVGAAARNIGLAPGEIGLLITVQNVGFMVSVGVVGSLSDRYRKPLLLCIGSGVLAVSFACFYIVDTFWVNLIVMAAIGVGIGAYEGATDAMLLDIHSQRENLIINLNHFFVSAGSVVITAYLLYLQMGWRVAVVQTAVVVALLTIVYGFIRIKDETRSSSRLTDVYRFLRKQRILGSLFVAQMCAIGLGMGTTGILTSFLMEYRAFNQITSKVALMIFLTGMALGRIYSGFFAGKRQIIGLVPVLFGASFFVFLTLFFADLPTGIVYVVVAVAGLIVAPLLPMHISLAGVLYRDMAGTAMGVVKVAIPAGGIVVPFVISIVSEATSFQISLAIFPVVAIVGLVAYLVSARDISEKYPD